MRQFQGYFKTGMIYLSIRINVYWGKNGC